jgi:hypothetical protein
MRPAPALLLVLGLLGVWAGTSLGQLPPPPSVTLPTVTVPSVPLPPPPPTPPVPPPPPVPPAPSVTTPTVPVPTEPVPAVPAPIPVIVPDTLATPAAERTNATAPHPAPASGPAARHFGASSRFARLSRERASRPWVTTTIATRPPPVESSRRSGVAGVRSHPRHPYDDASGPLGAAVGTIRSAAEAVPPVLYALAALAVALLALAAMPQPVRASRAGAALVHHRGSLALAGIGVLITAVLTFALLS